MRSFLRFLVYAVGLGCVVVALFFTVKQYGNAKTVLEIGLGDPWFVRTVANGTARHELRPTWSALAAVGAVLWLSSGLFRRRTPPPPPQT